MNTPPEACDSVPPREPPPAVRRPRWLLWSLLFLVGLALINFAYRKYVAPASTRWTDAVIYIAEDGPAADLKPLGGTPVTLRLLPVDPQTELLAKQLAGAGNQVGHMVVRNRQEKLILVENFRALFDGNMLASGRLPEPGAGEVLAGYDASRKDALSIDGQKFKVVGVLRRQNAPFWNSYLLPDARPAAKWLDPASPQVKPGVLVTRVEARKQKEALMKSRVRGRLTALSDMSRVEPGPYFLYLLGLLFLVGGGAAMLLEGFWAWSNKATSGWFAAPLVEMRRHWRLLVGLHAGYFGLCLAAMVVIYFARDIQDILFMIVLKEITGTGMLGIVGKAYLSGNILWAAVATVGVNFFAGSLGVITLPSVILPGSGTLVAFYRAGLWGVLLAPAYPLLAGTMRAHSVTLLLEGEGYILATFFGLLVPIFLLRRQEGVPGMQRWGRALLVNLKGNLLVFLVLAIAALYEAIEVILQAQK